MRGTLSKWVGISVLAAVFLTLLNWAFNVFGIQDTFAGVGLLLIGFLGLYVLKIHKRGFIKEDFVSLLFVVIAAMGISSMVSVFLPLPAFTFNWNLLGLAEGIIAVLLADVVLAKYL